MKNAMRLLCLFLFSSTQLLDQKYTISGYLEDASTGERMVGVNVVAKELSSLTKSYFLYEKHRFANRDSEDFFGGEPIQIYTNVKNGLGVFVGKTTDEQIIEVV
tara:strand:- start:241 stop:552 length:312 start_codon:yes stop_codon:yes gene_type:complete